MFAKQGSGEHCQCQCERRILVVDNDPEDRADHVKCLKDWGFRHIFEATGKGFELIDDAMQKAAENRCHLALVDMRLRDNDDPDDFSGLKLLRNLLPTKSILVTGYGDMFITRQALLEEGAEDVIGKQESLKRLEQAVRSVLCDSCNGRIKILFPPEWTIEEAAKRLSPDPANVRVDEIRDVMGYLFKGAGEVRLEYLNSTTNSPLPSRRQRNSLVFAAQQNGRAPVVLKLATADRVNQEVANYNTYVRDRLGNFMHSQLQNHEAQWTVGGMVYALIGGNLQEHKVTSFADKLQRVDDATPLATTLREHFESVWDMNYRDVETEAGSLINQYFQAWCAELQLLDSEASTQKYLNEWQRQKPNITLAQIKNTQILNPFRWIADNADKAHFDTIKRAIIHGDLHGNNLFVDADFHPWLIDFGRTGRGYILFDVSEITQYILTRIVQLPDDDLTLLYELSVCLADFASETLRITSRLRADLQGRKAHVLINELRNIARDNDMYAEEREYLWSILLEAVFVSLVLPIDDPRQVKLRLLAAVLCQRLDSWPSADWIPDDWPRVQFAYVKTGSSRREPYRLYSGDVDIHLGH